MPPEKASVLYRLLVSGVVATLGSRGRRGACRGGVRLRRVRSDDVIGCLLRPWFPSRNGKSPPIDCYGGGPAANGRVACHRCSDVRTEDVGLSYGDESPRWMIMEYGVTSHGPAANGRIACRGVVM